MMVRLSCPVRKVVKNKNILDCNFTKEDLNTELFMPSDVEIVKAILKKKITRNMLLKKSCSIFILKMNNIESLYLKCNVNYDSESF